MGYDNRVSARQRGYDANWEKARKLYLQENPLCVMCSTEGKIVPAGVVDHKIPHRGDRQLFWDQSNWQALCKPHHDSHKQSIEVRGFSTAIGADGWPIDAAHPANAGKTVTRIGNAMTHPSWFRQVHIPLTIVCGCPGSGKSTYVRQNAGTADRIICFDQIAASIYGSNGHDRAHANLSGDMFGNVLRQRNEALADLMRASAKAKWPAAWLIVSEPRAERRQWWAATLQPKTIVVMQTPKDVCKARVREDARSGDARHRSVEASIDRWWAEYTPRPGDLIVCTGS